MDEVYQVAQAEIAENANSQEFAEDEEVPEFAK